MMNINNTMAFGAALILAASMGSVYAEDADLTKTRTQDRIQSELNQQTIDGQQEQSRYRKELNEEKAKRNLEQKKEQHKKQIENKHSYKDEYKSQQQNDHRTRAPQNTKNQPMRGKH